MYAEICNNIINNNIVENNGTKGFRAGSSVYANFWSRDFLYSAPFLMKNKKWRDAVAQHTFLILKYMRRKDHMMPKEIDTMNPDWRVVRGTFRTLFGMGPEKIPMNGKWVVFYTDTIGSDAIDTNLLTINSVIELSKYDDYNNIIMEKKKDILNGMKYYDKYINDGLIYQMEFSDFQDSSSRKGATFLTNLLYWKVLKGLEENGLVQGGKADQVKNKIKETFWIEKLGLYRGIKNRKYMNIDASLLAVYWDFETSQTYWNSIKNYKPWWKNNYPGPPTVPEQPYFEKSINVRIAGVSGYHDKYIWSWVLGLATTIACRMKDRAMAEKLLGMSKIIVERDKTVYDSYEYRDGSIYQVKTYAFRAEHDWTWGASFILESHLEFLKLC
jgi:hypothetical protein